MTVEEWHDNRLDWLEEWMIEGWDSLTSEEKAYRIDNHFEGEIRLDPETDLIKGYKLA